MTKQQVAGHYLIHVIGMGDQHIGPIFHTRAELDTWYAANRRTIRDYHQFLHGTFAKRPMYPHTYISYGRSFVV